MDIAMFAVNVAVVSLVFVPYYIFIRLGQQEYRKINKEFNVQKKRHNLKIDHMERWNLNAIGIDFTQQKLLFVQRRNEEIFAQVYDLSSIKMCQETSRHLSLRVDDVLQNILQTVDLELVHYNGEEKTVISLYNSDLTYNEDFELKHVQKWTELITRCISSRPIYKKVA